MRNPHFCQKCCHFRWLCFDFSKNDNTCERNEDCATVFLKWTDFSLHIYLCWISWTILCFYLIILFQIRVKQVQIICVQTFLPVLSKMLEQCAHKNPLDYESPNPTQSTGHALDRSKFDFVFFKESNFRMKIGKKRKLWKFEFIDKPI